MSEIGTHRQTVNQDHYNEGFIETFGERAHKSGKTVYVHRNGKLVPKGSVVVSAEVVRPNELTASMNLYTEKVVASMAIPAEKLEGHSSNFSMSARMG